MTIYKSCSWIEHGLVFDHCNTIRVCNNFNSKYGGRPILFSNYNGELIDKEDLFKLKQKHREDFKEGEILPQCQDCVLLETKDWDDEHYIDNLLLTPWIECNSRCVYCSAPEDEYVKANTKRYNLIPVVKKMIKDNVLKKDSIIDFAGGEPTIYKDFDKLLRLFIDNGFQRIDTHTNAIKYSRAIEKGIKMGVVNILVSIDAGTKEMHKKIKTVSSFDIVWHNLSKYAKAKDDTTKLVRTKYIIVPGVNDSEEEINLWLEKSKSIGLKNLVLNIDYNWMGENIGRIPESIINLVAYTMRRVEELGLYCDLYAQARELNESI